VVDSPAPGILGWGSGEDSPLKMNAVIVVVSACRMRLIRHGDFDHHVNQDKLSFRVGSVPFLIHRAILQVSSWSCGP
jgi:hypothetical protein